MTRASLTQIYIHFVWKTWDQEPILVESVKERLYAAMLKRCDELECPAIAIGGIEDHVHLLVYLHPSIAVANLVKDIKGASSHLMNHEIRRGGNFRWQGSYGAFSIRENEVEQVKAYILNQHSHHANNTICEHDERTYIIT